MRSTFEFFKVTFSAPNRFEPASAEEKFLCDYAKRFLAHRRAMSVLAVVYWSAFSLWDLAQALQSDQFQHVVAYVLALRLLGMVCLAGCAWLSFRKAFANERYATAVLISMVGSAYFLLGLMLLLLPFPMNYIYYSPGHFMVLIFAHGMFRLRAKPALRLTIALVLFSEFIYAYMANDAVEQGERLLHSIDSLVFEEQLVVFGDGNQKKNRSNIFKAMNPLLSLRPLPTHVEHAIGEVLNDECSLSDTGGLDSRSENILVIGEVVVGSNAVD